jgi:hypothetical protein
MNNCLDYKENLLIYSRGSLEEALTAVTVITELTAQHNKLITN